MNERIVLNTGPIISLGKMQAFELISRLPYVLICPGQVADEITAGRNEGHDISMPSMIDVIKLGSPLSARSLASLDAGEAAVIELASEIDVHLVCIDELKGRRAATAAGLRVVGSLGLLGRAKRLGLVDRVGPFIERANTNGVYYGDELVKTFLDGIGE